MNDTAKGLLSDMLHPPLLPWKKRLFSALFIGLPFAFLLLHFYYHLHVLPSAGITLLFALLFAACFIWEIRAGKQNAAFKQAIEDGGCFDSEEWREKYRIYCEKHGFTKISAQSMKADLNRHFLKPSGIVLAAASLGFFVPAAIWDSGETAVNVILAITGLLFLAWGLYKLLRTPVRAFLRDCGDSLPHIERSYLNGRLLTYRRSGLSAVNSGINIGGDYTVMWCKKEIQAIENRSISDVKLQVHRTKQYVDSLYAGTETAYYIRVTYADEHGKNWNFKIRLNEFQAKMVYDALAPLTTAVDYSESMIHEIG